MVTFTSPSSQLPAEGIALDGAVAGGGGEAGSDRSGIETAGTSGAGCGSWRVFAGLGLDLESGVEREAAGDEAVFAIGVGPIHEERRGEDDSDRGWVALEGPPRAKAKTTAVDLDPRLMPPTLSQGQARGQG